MCTLAAMVRPGTPTPLVVAANRDERLDRPAVGPFLWPSRPRFLAPRDELAGGTWLGLNEHGLFVGVTNRTGAPRDATRRSRGALVVEALGAPSARELHARLADLDPGAHNPFHLLYADRISAHLTWSDGRALHRADLAPGLHVVTEQTFGAGEDRRGASVREAWAALGEAPSDEQLQALLARHADDPFAATCVHLDAFDYGTRSSMLLRLGPGWADTMLAWAEGRPCVTPFVSQRELLASLPG
jgi:uncharacterized protein with NRDE domain